MNPLLGPAGESASKSGISTTFSINRKIRIDLVRGRDINPLTPVAYFNPRLCNTSTSDLIAPVRGAGPVMFGGLL